ncbi:hypothetical protein LXL04_020689 [Taraxacum kok-saghyz]
MNQWMNYQKMKNFDERYFCCHMEVQFRYRIRGGYGYVTKLEKLSGTPILQTLAFKLLGQPTSSSCAERNWSTYAFIHSLKRNKLTPSRAQDLVYIHNNLRLLSRTPNDDVNMWDVGGDAFDSMEDVGFLEVANLSLDEPRFENDIISEN